ncbi:MAG: cell division protein ZipA [Gammaproteobacteria bacterium]|nr:cell division protein ZipA [Gammaproteobacteria bacterium]
MLRKPLSWPPYDLMDINVRDWMVIVGALLVLAVLLDGYRRMRNNSSRVRVSLVKVSGEGEEDDDGPVLHELPNGGARVVTRDEEEPEAAGDSPEPPLLTEPGEYPAAGENLDLLQGLRAPEKDVATDTVAESSIQREVVLMYVTAREEAGFAGEDILHILLACDLRFGEMDFFHRHEQAAGRGSIQFSVANMMQPGVFDIDAMASFSTSGLTFFLALPGPEDMMQAFEHMLETTECVANHLGGDLLDETRSAMTKQTLEHTRQRIRDLERRLLTQSSHIKSRDGQDPTSGD